MKTLSQILTCILPLYAVIASAQTVSFDQINSSNVLAVIYQIPKQVELRTSPQTTALQYGNGNFAEISSLNNSIISVMQIGDHNFLNFENPSPNTKGNSVITTLGNNTIIDVTGSNSISDKIQIHVKGDNRIIFMRNY